MFKTIALAAALLAVIVQQASAVAPGDFNPENNLYYGLNFNVLPGAPLQTDLVVVSSLSGAVKTPVATQLFVVKSSLGGQASSVVTLFR
jgi:hypothetical protein